MNANPPDAWKWPLSDPPARYMLSHMAVGNVQQFESLEVNLDAFKTLRGPRT
jgi:hypothetical protein